MTGAARVVLVVKVPAATQGTSEIRIARSLIEASDLMQQAVTPARKPCGAVTQLSISRNISDKGSTSSMTPIACSIVLCASGRLQPLLETMRSCRTRIGCLLMYNKRAFLLLVCFKEVNLLCQ